MRMTCALLLIASFAAGHARAETAREAILADLAAKARAESPSFAGFSAERGRALFESTQAGGRPDTPSCTTCHGRSARAPGQNVRTGKAIAPMAASVSPARFTVAEEVEKWFLRNCRDVLGRACSALERGDVATHLLSQ